MEKRLIRTFLSKRAGEGNVFVGIFSFLVLLAIFLFSGGTLEANGALVFDHGEWWRAFTTSLMHADLIHLGHNALFFMIFAVLLNTYFGWFMFPLVSFIMGGVINILTLAFYPRHVYLVGISGVIYFMAAFWMTSYVMIERKMKFQKRLLIGTGISLALFCPDIMNLDPKVSYLAHAMGFIIGIPSALFYFLYNKKRIQNEEVWIEKTPVNYEWEEAIELLPPE